MSSNRQILARPGGPSRSIQVNQKTLPCPGDARFAPNSRHWMRRIYEYRLNPIGPSRAFKLAYKQRKTILLV
jgi:hypothetical protein